MYTPIHLTADYLRIFVDSNHAQISVYNINFLRFLGLNILSATIIVVKTFIGQKTKFLWYYKYYKYMYILEKYSTMYIIINTNGRLVLRAHVLIIYFHLLVVFLLF